MVYMSHSFNPDKVWLVGAQVYLHSVITNRHGQVDSANWMFTVPCRSSGHRCMWLWFMVGGVHGPQSQDAMAPGVGWITCNVAVCTASHT